MCSDCEPLIKAIDAFLQKADNNLSGELTSEGYASGKKTVKAINRLEDDIADALQEETKYIADEARKADSLQDFSVSRWASVKRADNTSEKLSRTFRDEFTEFMPGIIDNYIQQTDRELHLESISKVTTGWIRDWSGQLGEIMQLTSHDEIESILVDGLEKGVGIPEFTQQIMDSGIRDEQYRARATALTEVLRAHSVAQQEAFSQSPSVTKKMWRHTGSYRNTPRPNHVDMDRQVVHTEDAFFMEGIYGGYYYPDYPRDPNLPPEETINCHCLMEPVADADILGLSLEERQELQRQAVEELNEGWEEEHPNEEPPEEQEEAEPEEEDYSEIRLINQLNESDIEYRRVEDLTDTLTETQIINKLAGGDETGGSCASLALSYAANKNGMDVTDYRGGESQKFFARNYWRMVNPLGIYESETIIPSATFTARSDVAAANKALKKAEIGKEYILCAGRHAAVVQRTESGFQYLEMQSAIENGWKDFAESTGQTFKDRFGCTQKGKTCFAALTDVDSIEENGPLRRALGYLNTAAGSQKKGASGHAK